MMNESENPEDIQQDQSTEQFADAPSEDAKEYLQRREREMQADYTRKTQQVADLRKKAEAFDAMSMQNAQSMFNMQQQNLKSAVDTSEKESMEAIDALEPQAVKGVEALIKKVLSTQLMPELSMYKTHIDGMVRENVTARWDALQREYPEAAKYQQQMVQFLQANPGVSDLKQALMAVGGEEIVSSRARQVESDRRRSQLTRPTVSHAQTEPVKKKKQLWEYFQEL